MDYMTHVTPSVKPSCAVMRATRDMECKSIKMKLKPKGFLGQDPIPHHHVRHTAPVNP